MKKLIALLLCLSLSALPVLTSCNDNDDPADDTAADTPAASGAEAVGEAFNEGLIVSQDEGYSGVPCADDNQKIEKYVVHFWYTLKPGCVYRDVSITVNIHLTFHNEDGTVAAEQAAAYTLRYDVTGQLIGEEPTVDENGDKSIVREIVLEEANQAYFFMDTDVEFKLTCSGTVLPR